MQSIEITGKSVADATKAASAKLGVAEDQLTVTVIEETKGLFGKSNVRVKAEVKAVVETAPKPAKASNGKAAPVEKAPVAEKEAPAAEKAPRRGKPKAEAKSAEPAEEASVETAQEPEEATEAAVMATDADAKNFLDLINDLIQKADLEVTANVTQVSGRYVNIELDGKDAAYLVGKHGEVLNALQYLVNIIAGRSFGNGVRATIDGNQYRNRREQQLTAHAQRVADEVKKRSEEAVLDALPAFERRIVHKALSEYAGVTTYSEGEEPNRRVVIAPAE